MDSQVTWSSSVITEVLELRTVSSFSGFFESSIICPIDFEPLAFLVVFPAAPLAPPAGFLASPAGFLASSAGGLEASAFGLAAVLVPLAGLLADLPAPLVELAAFVILAGLSLFLYKLLVSRLRPTTLRVWITLDSWISSARF